MKLAYMYATPDVGHSKVTAIQGDPSSTLARIRETGYTGVELLVRDPREIDVVALHDAVNDAGLDVPAICTGEVYGEDKVSFADPDPQCRREARDRMRSAMELAARFGASVNVGRLRGRYGDEVPASQTLQWIEDAIRECAQAWPDVRILMEPVNHLYANCLMGTQDMLDFIERVNLPSVGLMLDMVHIIIEGEDLLDSLQKGEASGRLWHFHFSDSDRLPMGDGHYDIAAVIKALQAVGYTGYTTVETFQIPDASHAMEKSFNTLKPYF